MCWVCGVGFEMFGGVWWFGLCFGCGDYWMCYWCGFCVGLSGLLFHVDFVVVVLFWFGLNVFVCVLCLGVGVVWGLCFGLVVVLCVWV